LYKVIQTSRLYEQIVQQIEDSILKGDLSEGSQLPAERDLAKQFGVSRTAVREAIKALQEKGLVDAFPGRGTFVTKGTSNSMRRYLDRLIKSGEPDGWAHVVEMREILEPEIAALAAVRATDQDLATMREVTGGTPYGASCVTGAGSELRMPSALELDMCRFQGEHVARLSSYLVAGARSA